MSVWYLDFFFFFGYFLYVACWEKKIDHPGRKGLRCSDWKAMICKWNPGKKEGIDFLSNLVCYAAWLVFQCGSRSLTNQQNRMGLLGEPGTLSASLSGVKAQKRWFVETSAVLFSSRCRAFVPIIFLSFLFFRVDMLKQVSWQPSKLWMLPR